MARTRQMLMKQNKPMLHSQQASDHLECLIVRIRFAMPDESIPFEGFREHKPPIFAFQVYITVPVDLYDEDVDPSEKEGVPYGWLTLHRLAEYLWSSTPSSSSSSPPATPVFEIYTGTPDDVAGCVEHQRQEIAHRKAMREDRETLLIPKVALDADNFAKSRLIIVIGSESYKKDSAAAADDEGPTFVFFDNTIGSTDGEVGGLQIEEIGGPEISREFLAELYNRSYAEMDFGLNEVKRESEQSQDEEPSS